MKDTLPTPFTDDDASLDAGTLWKVALASLANVIALASFNRLFAFTFRLLQPLFVLIGLALVVLWLLDWL